MTVIKSKFHIRRGVRSQKTLCSGERPAGALPRLTKLMALAIHFDNMLTEGVVRTQSELAEFGHVSRARITQIMNLLNLAPDIQEAILFLPRVDSGRDPISEREIRSIVAQPDWMAQRQVWQQLDIGSLTV